MKLRKMDEKKTRFLHCFDYDNSQNVVSSSQLTERFLKGAQNHT